MLACGTTRVSPSVPSRRILKRGHPWGWRAGTKIHCVDTRARVILFTRRGVHLAHLRRYVLNTWRWGASSPCVGLCARTHAHKGQSLGLQLQWSAAEVGCGASQAASPNSSAGGFLRRAEVPSGGYLHKARGVEISFGFPRAGTQLGARATAKAPSLRGRVPASRSVGKKNILSGSRFLG